MLHLFYGPQCIYNLHMIINDHLIDNHLFQLCNFYCKKDAANVHDEHEQIKSYTLTQQLNKTFTATKTKL